MQGLCHRIGSGNSNNCTLIAGQGVTQLKYGVGICGAVNGVILSYNDS
jgi:hypothetical protein